MKKIVSFLGLLLSLALLTTTTVISPTMTAEARPLSSSASYLPAPGTERVFTTSTDIKIAYYEYGRSPRVAPTIVVTGSWPWSAKALNPLMRIMAERYHVLRYDHRGFGNSSKPSSIHDYKLELLAEDLHELLNHVVHSKKVHFFGMEWGGYIFSEYAARHANRVASLTTVGLPSIDIGSQAVADAWKEGTPQERAAATEFIVTSSVLPLGLVAPGAVDLALLSGMPSTVINKITTNLRGDWDSELHDDELINGRKIMQANLLQRKFNPQYSFLDIPLLHVIDTYPDPVSSRFVSGHLHKYTNRVILREIKGVRSLAVMYPVTLMEDVNEAITIVERATPTV